MPKKTIAQQVTNAVKMLLDLSAKLKIVVSIVPSVDPKDSSKVVYQARLTMKDNWLKHQEENLTIPDSCSVIIDAEED